MKYIVMECHDAFAVLMDEESRFVTAANLHYEVGQTVTNPILSEQPAEETPQRSIRMTRVLTRIAAAAACLILAAGGGYAYYARNLKPHSVVLLSSQANIKMYLSKSGDVISLKSENDAGAELLEDYVSSKKNTVTVAHELLALQISKGYISSGDTVDVYIEAKDSDAYDTYKSEFESDISGMNLNVHVQDIEQYHEQPAEPEKPEHPAPPAPPKPDDKPHPADAPKPHETPAEPKKPEPPAPKTPDAPPAPVTPPEAPAVKTTPEQPAPLPDAPKPDAPKPDQKPDEPEKPVKPEEGHPDAEKPDAPQPEAVQQNAPENEKPPHLNIHSKPEADEPEELPLPPHAKNLPEQHPVPLALDAPKADPPAPDTEETLPDAEKDAPKLPAKPTPPQK